MSSRRLVSFGGSTVEVTEHDSEAVALSKFIFERFPRAMPDDPCIRLELASDGPATFALWRDRSLVYRETASATAARLLLAEAVHCFSINCRQDILMHAAAVTHAGRGFLLPGPSGAGKSTLAGWLDHHGFGCLSDEIVGLATADGRMSAFPRPICLQPDANAILGGVLAAARREGRVLEAEDALLVAQRSPVPKLPVSLDCIIFPRYVPRMRTELRSLPKTTAAIRLLGSVANVRSRPDRGFAEMGILAGRVPVFELCYGDFAGCAEALMQSLGLDAIGVSESRPEAAAKSAW